MKVLHLISFASIVLVPVLARDGVRKAHLFNVTSPQKNRIVGGTIAYRYEFPYQISYQLNGKHICGGSILTSAWVVIAGHCITGTPTNTRVVAGILNLGEVNSDVRIVGIYRQIIHPQYPGGVSPHDIALLQLQQPLSWSSAIQPIALPQVGQEFSGYAWATGWGYLSSSNPVTPTQLRKVELYIESYSECANYLISMLGTSYPLDNSMICFVGGYTGRESICEGDSGGPIMQNGRLIGVASWTLIPCGMYDAPSVYTKTSWHLDFIRKYVPGV